MGKVTSLYIWRSLAIGGVLLLGCMGFAQGVSKRSITLDWEEVPDSVGYQIEVTKVGNDGSRKSPAVFKTKTPSWTGKIFPGKYEMRLRSIDDREVPGDWSDPQEFWVKVPPSQPLKPVADAQIKTGEDENFDVQFQWKKVDGVTGYRLEVLNTEGKSVLTQDASETSVKVNLPVGAIYTWKVTPLMSEEGNLGEAHSEAPKFTLVGRKLKTPAPEKPSTKFVTDVTWNEIKYADGYSYALLRKSKDGKWQVTDRKAGIKDPKITLDPHSPGGNYRIQVKAIGTGRESSETGSVDFYVYEGTRTPAAIDAAMLKEAIEKEYDNYFIASYLLTSVDYVGKNRQAGQGAKYNVLSGTGRLGYGYMPKGKWGFIMMADMGGILIKEKNYTFASAEAQAVWRKYIMRVTQWRAYGGLFMRQIPEAVPLGGGTSTAPSNEVDVKNITVAGPHAGTMLWHPFSYRFGMQLNAQVYLNGLGLQTPNGKPLEPTISYQAGLMGSYKLKENITGFAGYALRVDEVKYKAIPTTEDRTSYAVEGQTNDVTMTGNYLNLYLEWGF